MNTDKLLLLDKKRFKALRRSWLFNLVPFIDRVYIAGSLALGHVHENSDFDVIVVTRPGRLYTARFFCLLFFGLLGWRRMLKNPKDGFCFNHFTSGLPANVKFSHSDGRHNKGIELYAECLYRNLIEMPTNSMKLSDGLIRPMSKTVERLLKWWQIRRIEKFLKKFPPPVNSIIIYNDEKVELCFDLKEKNS